MSSIRMLSSDSPIRLALDDRMNSIMKDSNVHTRTNSITSPNSWGEGMTAQVQRMKLEADLLLEGGDIPEYIRMLDELYDKIKVDNRFKKLVLLIINIESIWI